MGKTPLKRYSQAFKQQVVREYEAGATAKQLSQKYGITGGSTLAGWVKRFSRYGTSYQVMVIQTPDEQQRVKELESRIQELESTLAKATLDNFMLETIIMVADEEHGLELKKKSRQLTEYCSLFTLPHPLPARKQIGWQLNI